ncbi:hypothetical protein DPX16_20721 [Anabarilius grahami]|uniref:Uncharacterized protein n=1 Tax=Anabarilius grahami TaxID=495550 RepID=A0A3N0YDZ6_ANAGA|nr:hypothetical protein DPX16_20721 [Anabarilius grahami]
MKGTESKNKRKLCTSEQRESSTEGKDEILVVHVTQLPCRMSAVHPFSPSMKNQCLQIKVHYDIEAFLPKSLIMWKKWRQREMHMRLGNAEKVLPLGRN